MTVFDEKGRRIEQDVHVAMRETCMDSTTGITLTVIRYYPTVKLDGVSDHDAKTVNQALARLRPQAGIAYNAVPDVQWNIQNEQQPE